MKKKGILIFIVLLISVAAIFFANQMQKKLVSNEVASKTESSVLQGNLKENTNEDSKKDANANTQNTDKASNSEIKNEETKNSSKTAQQNSSNKVNETSKQSTSKTVAPKSSNTNTNSSTSTNASQTPNSGTNPNQTPNFIVRDEVNNKIICSTRVNFQGRNVADITKDTLTKFSISYSYISGYFRSINGIKERSLNPSTDGWCYYIKDKKPSIGSSDYTPEDNATITWKYVKDGTKP